MTDASSSTPGEQARHGKQGLLLGRIVGIPVYVASTWFVVAAVITVLFAPTVAERLPGVGPWRYAISLSFAVLLYLSVLVHELSHSLTALRLGLRVRRITLHLLGGASEMDQPRSPGTEFLVSFAGPAVSLLLAAGGYVLAGLLDPGTIAGLLVLLVAYANLLVGVFNLLPALPLDGGHVLAAAIWKIAGRRLTGVVVAAGAGRLLAVLLGASSLLPLLDGRSPDAFSVLVALMVATFVWVGAGQAVTAARVRERLGQASAGGLARRALLVRRDLPVSQAVADARAQAATALVVVDEAGQASGIVEESLLASTPEHRRPWITTGEVARDLHRGLVLDGRLSGDELLAALRRSPAPEYLVVQDGRVYGVLSAADVERAVTGPPGR